MVIERARYRAAQFAGAVRATFEPVDISYVSSHLRQTENPTALLQLFRKMPRVEQHHGIRVCQALERQGYTDSHLLVAALLHDVGKTVAPLRLWERVLVVLVERLFPKRVVAWGRSAGNVKGIRRGFVVRRHHMAWGAELAAQAGAAVQTVALIRQHHNPAGADPDPLLEVLQMADESIV